MSVLRKRNSCTKFDTPKCLRPVFNRGSKNVSASRGTGTITPIKGTLTERYTCMSLH